MADDPRYVIVSDTQGVFIKDSPDGPVFSKDKEVKLKNQHAPCYTGDFTIPPDYPADCKLVEVEETEDHKLLAGRGGVAKKTLAALGFDVSGWQDLPSDTFSGRRRDPR